jgi:hypothetical protein
MEIMGFCVYNTCLLEIVNIGTKPIRLLYFYRLLCAAFF